MTSRAPSPGVPARRGEVWLTDINGAMLAEGRDRLLDAGLDLPLAQCDAEHLPFSDGHFDRVSVAFGLRNMTHKDAALAEMARVLRPGGRLLVLEFSRIWQPLAPLYDAYSFNVLPWLGGKLAGDSASYRYLAESIRDAPTAAGTRANDGTRGPRRRPMVQSDGGRLCTACRHQILNRETG